MLVLFFIPLTLIAFYESVVEANRSRWVQHYFGRADDSEDDSPATRDPAPAQADSARGLKISHVPFTQLAKVFPNSALSSEATILNEVREVKGQLEKLMERLRAKDTASRGESNRVARWVDGVRMASTPTPGQPLPRGLPTPEDIFWDE